jgi:hypothetical protein
MPGELPAQSNRRLRDAVDSASGADFELACCARALNEGGRPDLAAKADSLFRAALDFRRQLEREVGHG